MERVHSTFRSTLVGGVLFLLPLILIAWLLSKALKVVERLSDPLADATGLHTVGGVAVGTVIAIAILLVLAYFAGLIARTRVGQATFSSFEHSVLSVLPQWRMARGLIESFDHETASQMEVVLVPTDAGWGLGFVLEKPDENWWTVYIPGAPQWTSGSISYAHSKHVRKTNLTFDQAIILLRRYGTGSAPVHALLASSLQKGSPGSALDQVRVGQRPALRRKPVKVE